MREYLALKRASYSQPRDYLEFIRSSRFQHRCIIAPVGAGTLATFIYFPARRDALALRYIYGRNLRLLSNVACLGPGGILFR